MESNYSKVYIKDLPTAIAGVNQKLVLVERGDEKFGFIKCPHDRGYFIAKGQLLERLETDVRDGGNVIECRSAGSSLLVNMLIYQAKTPGELLEVEEFLEKLVK